MDELSVFDSAARPQWSIALNIRKPKALCISNQSDRLVDWEQWLERDESFAPPTPAPVPVLDPNFPIDPELLIQAMQDELPTVQSNAKPCAPSIIPSPDGQPPVTRVPEPGESVTHSSSGNKVRRQRDQGRSRISNEAKGSLMTWLEEHRCYPYPDKKEMQDLSAATDLPIHTVINWFANARRRYLPKLLAPVFQEDNLVMDGAEELLASSIGGTLGSSSNSIRRMLDTRFALSERLSPSMIGYLSTPIEEESVPRAVIESAATIIAPQSSWSTQESPNEAHYDTVSISNESSRSSVGSALSSSSFLSQSFSDRRKGRRLAPKRALGGRGFRFHCTFCTIGFFEKHAWKRHEESQHMRQEVWICMANGPTIGPNSDLSCLFCGSSDISYQHLVSQHNAIACYKKPIAERTFARRDNLKQHLKQVHKSVLKFSSLQSCHQPVPSDGLWECGFCHEEFDTWPSRVEHVAKHFNEGLDLQVWFLLGLTRQLSLAASTGDCTAVQRLLQQVGVDPNGCPGDNSLPLPSAARYGHEAVVSLLLKYDGTKPIAKKQRIQAMSLAVEHGHETIARMLWEDIFVDQPSAEALPKDQRIEETAQWPDEMEHTLKAVLATHHEDESSDWLPLDHEPVDPLSQTLFLLVKERMIDELQLLFRLHEVDVNVKNELDETPLFIAASTGDLEITRLLLQQKGIEINARDVLEHTALYHAASAEHEAVVRLLLEHGAHPEKDEFECRSPLELARRNLKY